MYSRQFVLYIHVIIKFIFEVPASVLLAAAQEDLLKGVVLPEQKKYFVFRKSQGLDEKSWSL